MSNITVTKGIDIATELANLDLYKYHPNGIVNVTLNRLTDMLDGKVEVVEPSNPFTYLLETSCLNTAFAIQEYTLLTRKLYPKLANSESDLYLHMSDLDYLGRFSEPAYGYVKYNILLSDFSSKAVYDPIQKEYVIKIPRHYKTTIDKYVFTLTSAVIIRQTENGIIDVKFENQTFKNIFPLDTNYISFSVFKVNQEETYITFDIKLPEIDIETVELPIEKSKLFTNIVTFNPDRKFYYFRAFHFKDSEWVEMVVTHTDSVYDINTPTAIIKVLSLENSIQYYIPPVYINTGAIGTKVKFLIYTTMGSVNINFSDFKVSDFSSEYNPVFPDIELDETTQSLQLITKVVYLKDEVIAGNDGVDFGTLKNNVINNSIGDRQLPITNKQLEYEADINNFKLIKNVDILTNRIFLLEVKVPNASTRYPITKINLDLIEYKTSINDLRVNGNNITAIGSNITIIPDNTIFKISNTGLYILTDTERTELIGLAGTELVSELNNNKYVSTLYHYVLDTSNNQTNLRPYDISSPYIVSTNFKEFNSTGKVGINTVNSNIVKSAIGFTIDILSDMKKYEEFINETHITPYLVYVDEQGSKFYLQGSLFTSINNNPVYRFNLESNYHINSEDKIHITNFRDNNDIQANIFIDLNSTLEVIYISNIIPSNYVSSSIDSYIQNSYIAVNNIVVTLEDLVINFGYKLENLYARTHISTGIQEYELYTEAVPLRYNVNVYNASNVIIHHVNDIVMDDNNEVVYQHQVGDIKLDANNNPIPISIVDLDVYLNLLFIDYKAVIATKTVFVDYKKYIKKYITENIVSNAQVIQDQLLENTVVYVTVPKNINNINVNTATKTVSMSSMQSFVMNVHVNAPVYNDMNIRDNISYTIINETDAYLSSNTVITKTRLLDILYNKLKEFIVSVSIAKFTELDEEYISLSDVNSRISLNKTVILDPEGYNLSEDIVINFLLVT